MISADEFKKLMDFAFEAHQNRNTSGQEYRQDGQVPYITHPLWCALILITDTRVPRAERELGCKALMLHDVLEDTSLQLPDWVGEDVEKTVKELTFKDFDQAKKEIPKKSPFIKLLILVDKLSSMYEEHVTPDMRKDWEEVVDRLTKDVELTYGDTRIVQMAKMVLENTDWS